MAMRIDSGRAAPVSNAAKKAAAQKAAAPKSRPAPKPAARPVMGGNPMVGRIIGDAVNQTRWAGEAPPTTPSSRINQNTQPLGPSGYANMAEIMAKSGSTDPSDPYNWRGIAAALSGGGGSSPGGTVGGGGSSYSAPAPSAPAPAPSVFQAPSSVNASPVNQAPSAVTGTATGVVGAPSGATFQSIGGRPGTFGSFDRLRNQRSPRSGLSVTPEMLRHYAATRAAG